MIKRAFRKIFLDEKGSFSIEAILMFPMLAWAFMAMYVFFEGLRESNINLKATYTVADLLSRETIEIDQEYIDGMNTIYEWLSRSGQPVSLRMTVVRYDEDSDSHILVCSLGANGMPQYTQDDVNSIVSPNVPILADQSSAIVVETATTYIPIMDVGLTTTDISNLVVTAPRFADQFRCEGIGDGGGTAHDDGTDDDDGL